MYSISNKNNYWIVAAIALLLLFQLWECASVKPPPGGPEDIIPPIVTGVEPASGTTGLSTRKITVRFSEHLSQSSIDRGIQLFPRIPEDIETKYRGDEIIITLPEALDSSQTYILTLDRDITDEHNVPLDQSVHLAFSTGSTIHSGSIAGNVPNAERLAIHLWKLQDLSGDSLFATPPDYITDVGEDGNFEFQYLAPGEYRILALGKEMSGLPLDVQIGRYGLYSQDPIIVNQSDTVLNVNMLVQQELPVLKFLSGDWDFPNWGQIDFNRQIRTSEINVDISLQTDDGAIIYPDYFINPADSSSIIVFTAEPIIGDELLLSFNNLRDESGILIDSGRVNIQLDAEIDTSFIEFIAPKSRRIEINPESGTKPDLHIIFSKPIMTEAQNQLVLTIFKEDSSEFPTQLKWNSPMDLALVPQQSWGANKSYSLPILQSQITAFDSSTFKDSVTTVNIRSRKKIGYGRLLGSVDKKLGRNLVVLVKTLKKPYKQFASVVISQAGFELNQLPENTYSLLLFDDRNNNLLYDFGSAYPFNPSEWFYWLPDTIDIRANWDFELPSINLENLE